MSYAPPDHALPWPICWAGVLLIASAEGLRLKAYKCPAGIWTCGRGETDGVTPTTVWTQAQADQRFLEALSERAQQVLALCTEHPTDNQLAAMVSLAYNIGMGAFAKSSVLKAHNRGDSQAAARAFSLWDKARVGGVLQPLAGLTARRAAEAALYLRPEDDAPHQVMPQAVAAESTLAASPIAQSGAATAGLGALGVVSQAGDQIGAVSSTVGTAKSFVTDTLGIPASWFLPLVMIAAGVVVVVYRQKQRREGWA